MRQRPRRRHGLPARSPGLAITGLSGPPGNMIDMADAPPPEDQHAHPTDDLGDVADERRLVIRVQLPRRPRPTPPPPGARPTRVTTASGTVYLFVPKTMTAVRLRGDGAQLRRDGEPVALLNWPEPVLGARMELELMVREDGVPTVRATTRSSSSGSRRARPIPPSVHVPSNV
jgi:hypothetical protein